MNGAEIDERLKSQTAEVTGVPASQLDAMAKYWPYGAASIGRPLFDSTNKLPLSIIPFSGEQITYPCAALTRTPDITLQAGADALFGEMTWTVPGRSREVADRPGVLPDAGGERLLGHELR